MNTPGVATTRVAVSALLGAIESRDLRRIAATLSQDASWQNVPHPPADGRDAVVAMLGRIVTWSSDVRWDVVSAAYTERSAVLERVDRFLLDGEWYDVQCNGVFDVDGAGLVCAVRDYVDLGEWRGRAGPVLERFAARAPVDVVAAHLDAVRGGDVVAMAADYAFDAVLVRGEHTHDGWAAIADYFDSVPDRLGGRTVTFDDVTTTPNGDVQTRWTIAGDDANGANAVANGVDTFVVAGGRIVHQTVELLSADF
jgi:limonene-1,2-epoxide hydrolase